MKKLLSLFIILTACSVAGNAQIQNVNSTNSSFSAGGDPEPHDICGITYDYDAAGQRVKRSYGCTSSSEGGETQTPIRIDEFPNPTDGRISVFTNVLADMIQISIFNMQGISVLGMGQEHTNEIDADISSQPDGTYIVYAFVHSDDYGDAEESFTVVKLTQ